MRFFKKQMNPIFVEDEEYNWGGKRNGGLKLLFFLIIIALIAGVLMTYVG